MANKNSNYAKVAKIAEWVLLAIGVAITIYGSVCGWTAKEGVAIDIMLYWAYALVVIALLAIIILGICASAARSKRAAITIVAVLVGAVVLIGGAYLLAPASPAVGYVGVEPSFLELKLTDTMLNLTYLSCGLAVIAIIYSAISNALRK